MEFPKFVACFAILSVLINIKQYKTRTIIPTNKPHSSTIIGYMKSVCDSGKYRYFCVLSPIPWPVVW